MTKFVYVVFLISLNPVFNSTVAAAPSQECQNELDNYNYFINQCTDTICTGVMQEPSTSAVKYSDETCYSTNDVAATCPFMECLCTSPTGTFLEASGAVSNCDDAPTVPPTITSPPPANPPKISCGSIIQTSNLVLGETIPITGANFTLNYFSSYAAGRANPYQASMQVSNATVSAGTTGYNLVVKDYAGTTIYTHSFGNTANQTTALTWNGLDSAGKQKLGPDNLSVVLTQVGGNGFIHSNNLPIGSLQVT